MKKVIYNGEIVLKKYISAQSIFSLNVNKTLPVDTMETLMSHKDVTPFRQCVSKLQFYE